MYNILVLDDEYTHLSLIRDYLRFNGFEVFIFTSPLKALELVAKVKPDLIVLDIMMPELNGYNFIKKIKAFAPLDTIPFIFLSAKGLSQDRVKAYNMGCSGYISKPFDPEELVALIQNILWQQRKQEKKIVQTINQIQNIRFYLELQYSVFDLNFLYLGLTPQENRIVNYLIKGFKNKEIASRIGTGVRNIEKHITRVLTKTNTKNRMELIRFIYLNHFNTPLEN